MKNNKYQQLSLFEENINLPADVMEAINEARVAWLQRIHSKRSIRYKIYKGGVK